MTALAEALQKADPANENAKFDYAMALLTVGLVNPQGQDLAERIEYLERAVAEFEPLVRKGVPAATRNYAWALEYVGRRSGEKGDHRKAVQVLEKALTIAENAIASNPDQRWKKQYYLTAGALMEQGALVWPRQKTLDFTAKVFNRQDWQTLPGQEPRLKTARAQMYFNLGDRRAGCASAAEARDAWRRLEPNLATRMAREAKAADALLNGCASSRK
jgi:tetratricopeptide (TPR) repeat protein